MFRAPRVALVVAAVVACCVPAAASAAPPVVTAAAAPAALGPLESIDPVRGGVAGLACATPAACVAVSGDGTATVWNGHVWTAPAQVIAAPQQPEQGFLAVSCARSPQPFFCVAITASGAAVAYRDGMWQAPQQLAQRGVPLLTSVSCAAADFCLVADYRGTVYRFDGTRWRVRALDLPSYEKLSAVSCSSPRFCVAIGSGDDAIWDGATWHTSVNGPLAFLDERGTLSCPADGWCLAAAGSDFTVLDGQWRTGQVSTLVGLPYPRSVSCAASGDCVIGYADGQAIALRDGVFQASEATGGPGRLALDAMSCPAITSCVGGTSWDGAVIRYDGESWSGRRVIEPRSGYVTAVGCAAGGDCMLVDRYGNATRFDSGSAGGPVKIDSRVLVGVACAGATFCVAVDHNRFFLRWDGSSWTAPQRMTLPGRLAQLACSTPTLCMAVSATGWAARFDGASWEAPTRVLPSGGFRAVSCPPDGATCFALGAARSAPAVFATYRDDAWSTTPQTPPVSALSCPDATTCVALGVDDAYYWSDGVWSAPRHLVDPPYPDTGFERIACATRDSCVAQWGSGRAVVFDASGSEQTDLPTPIRGVACAASGCVVADDQGVRRT